MEKKHSCFDGYADGDEQMQRYHDEEWGAPCHDEKKLVELFINTFPISETISTMA
jgi:3-methyladenine DNA glycosylase Tag